MNKRATDQIAQYIVDYILKHGEFPWWEETIAKSAKASYEYARHVLKGPFPAGGKAIATSSEWSYDYVMNVLKGERFLLGEPAIATCKYATSSYIQWVLEKYDGKDKNYLAGTSYEYDAAQKKFIPKNPPAQETPCHIQ